MTVLRPATPKEALRHLARTPTALPLAGGTDLMVAWNLGVLNGRAVLDLSRLGEWTRIVNGTRSLRIGSLVTYAAVQRHPGILRRFPLLAEAAATIGGVQIQARGTIGGNIANASPAADSVPPLLVYDARVAPRERDAAAASSRVDEVFAGVKKTTLEPGELIEAIELPMPARPPDRQIFRKVGTRAAQAISKIVLAGVLWLAKDATVADVRLALGSMAPTPRRLRHAEAVLKGRRLTPDVMSCPRRWTPWRLTSRPLTTCDRRQPTDWALHSGSSRPFSRARGAEAPPPHSESKSDRALPRFLLP